MVADIVRGVLKSHFVQRVRVLSVQVGCWVVGRHVREQLRSDPLQLTLCPRRIRSHTIDEEPTSPPPIS